MATLANILHQALHQQWKQLDLFPEYDYHNNNVVANLFEFIHDPDVKGMTDYELLEVVAKIVAKRKQPEFDTIDCSTQHHYLT